LQNNINLSRF